MKKVYLFKLRKLANYDDVFCEDYFTGNFTDFGAPSVTNQILGAKEFLSTRQAYDYGAQFKKLSLFKAGWR